jgi:hypothetical protein
MRVHFSTDDLPPRDRDRHQQLPDHWRTLGNRHSTLSGTPRAAVTPGNAMLNYLYGVLNSEITTALHALGLDPALGDFAFRSGWPQLGIL